MARLAQPVTVKVYGRLSYANIFTPYEGELNKGNPKYGATILIDPKSEKGKESIKRIEAAVKQIELEAWKKSPQVWKDPKRFCLSNGNDHTVEVKNKKTGEIEDQVKTGYAGMKVLKASNKNQPWIKDSDGKTDLEPSDNRPYSGCWCNIIVNFAATEQGGRGLFAYMEGVQFIKHDEPLGGAGRVRPEDVLEDESDEVEDDDDV